MKQPPDEKRIFSSKQIIQIVFAVILIGVAFLILVALLLFWFPQILQWPPAQVASNLRPTSAIPTIFVPTPDCGPPTLMLGDTTYQIQTINPAPDSSLAVPADTSGIAYWVEGTSNNYAFVLSPTPENISLASTITAGITAKATWKNCNSTSYALLAPEPGFLSASVSTDQSIAGITVFILADTAGNGFVVKGELTEEQISTFNTPVIGGSEIQAEIGLLETTTSPDGSTIQIGVSIYNWGQAAFTLSTSDVSLTQKDSTVLAMVSSEPSLPKEIKPTATETLYFTFPSPSNQTATLKIFTVEYEVEGY